MSNFRAVTSHARALLRDDTGAATAEYAIATMATMAGLEPVSERPDTVRVRSEG